MVEDEARLEAIGALARPACATRCSTSCACATTSRRFAERARAKQAALEAQGLDHPERG